MGLSESRGLGPGEAPSERQVDEEDEAVAADPLLHMEARKGHCDTARQLLAQDPEALNSQDASGRTPLFWATEYRHERLVELLLAHGADPAVPDHEGNLCLHWAVYVGSPSIARMLLDAGSDVDALNGQGDSPLHLAAQERRYECLVLLLAHGAKVSLKNRAGQVALQCCKPSSPFWRALEAASARPPQPTERLLCRDISRGFEQVPIPCVNGVDEEPAPGAFLYVTQNFVSDSAVLPATGWGRSQHCECASSCSAPTCPCVERSLRSWYTPVRAAPALPGVRRGGQPEPLRASRPFLSSCGPGWPAGARRGQQHSRGGPHLRVPHALLLRQLLPQPGGAEGPQDAAAAVPGARQGLGSAHDAGGAPRSLPLPVLWGADFQRRGRPARGRRLFLCGGHAGGPRVLPGRALLRQRGPLPEPFVPAQPGGSAGGRGARDPRHRLLQRPGHPGGRRAGVRLRRALLGGEGLPLGLLVQVARLQIPAVEGRANGRRRRRRRRRPRPGHLHVLPATRLLAQIRAEQPAEDGPAPLCAAPTAPPALAARTPAPVFIPPNKEPKPAASSGPDCCVGGRVPQGEVGEGAEAPSNGRLLERAFCKSGPEVQMRSREGWRRQPKAGPPLLLSAPSGPLSGPAEGAPARAKRREGTRPPSCCFSPRTSPAQN
ncbi:uncharacterized protein LOC128401801 isoform X1 [Podarcis raffonei]|uniref:uncharacterized protein LOC128401801 isoform X1 n=1 Tax=Podarcis raffonei TaxID=65483 RepID=UPI0023290531|nr:uncharacterized protein LOC128401801 isoform X1 [Podarcis raffonei]